MANPLQDDAARAALVREYAGHIWGYLDTAHWVTDLSHVELLYGLIRHALEPQGMAAADKRDFADLMLALAADTPPPPPPEAWVTLGDAPIEERYRARMQQVARWLDQTFNGQARGDDRQTGFVLLCFPFGEVEGRCNFISNGAERRALAVLFREMIARFEGQPEPPTGHA